MTRETAKANHQRYLDELETLKSSLEFSAVSIDKMVLLLGLHDVLLKLAADYGLCAFAIESFMSLPVELAVVVGLAMALVYDKGIPVCHETDNHGAISSIIIEAAGLNERPSFPVDLTIRHPESKDGVLLWRDAFSLSLRDPSQRAYLVRHWIMPEAEPGMTHCRIAEGEVTVSRFDGDHGHYRLTALPARSIPGPFTENNYLWVEVPDWPACERHFVEEPYMHRVACAYGDHVAVLRESCRFVDGLEFDPIRQGILRPQSTCGRFDEMRPSLALLSKLGQI